MKLRDEEYQMNLRGALSQKQKLILILEKTYLKATSKDDFYTKLKKEKFDIYCRNDRILGVKLRRKYRFSTLGFTQEKLQKLELNLTQRQREQELKEMERMRNKDKNLEK